MVYFLLGKSATGAVMSLEALDCVLYDTNHLHGKNMAITVEEQVLEGIKTLPKIVSVRGKEAKKYDYGLFSKVRQRCPLLHIINFFPARATVCSSTCRFPRRPDS
jgi:hypothetical protein